MTTFIELVREISNDFNKYPLVYGHGTDNSWDEALVLVRGITNLPDDIRLADSNISQDDYQEIKSLASRRIKERIPMPYLLGDVRYVDQNFFCEHGVIIPRSPIGLLVNEGLKPWISEPPSLIVDVCCGTGCLGILCALSYPLAKVVLVDIDEKALALARRNIRRFNLEDRVMILAGDLLGALREESIDLIISNPPYVSQGDCDSLADEFKYEPIVGLDGGEDGLYYVSILLDQAKMVLKKEGLILCEVGQSCHALSQKYPGLPFVWIDLPHGGEGVFCLERSQINVA